MRGQLRGSWRMQGAHRGRVPEQWVVLLAALASGACVGQDIDRAWNVGEIRTVHAQSPPPEVGGDVFAVDVPIGVDRDELTLAASESLAIGRGARILELDRDDKGGRRQDRQDRPPRFGVVFSAGALRVDPYAELGSVYALGPAPPMLAPGVLMHGYLRAAAPLTAPRRWRAEQGVFDDAPDYIEEFHWQVTFPAAGGRVLVSHAFDPEDLRVEPGPYESLTLEPGSTMVVSTGTYRVRSLAVEPLADLVVDNTKGPVYVWVRDSLSIEGDVIDLSLAAPTLLFGYAGSEPPKIASRFRGTLVAPRATTSLPATPEPHEGSFFARNLIVADGAVVGHRAFAASPAETAPPSFVCTECVAKLGIAVRACADVRARAMRSLDEEAATCPALCRAHAGPDIGACSADCGERSERRRALSPDVFETCTEVARRGMETCENHAHYRAGTCWYLGYSLDVH